EVVEVGAALWRRKGSAGPFAEGDVKVVADESLCDQAHQFAAAGENRHE
ncbi:MAG TPA: hypothetical protein EYP98_16075, partial [Planctomycetes bacterium]|nr:hypothetical protein [Planctomycetota bacterium]